MNVQPDQRALTAREVRTLPEALLWSHRLPSPDVWTHETALTMHEEGFPALVQWTGEGAVDVVVVGVGL